MSQYFNINMINDYLELGLKFKVYVNGEYLIVNEPWDLLNDYKAIGYDINGSPVEFEYMDVDHIMIGSNVFTKDELNNVKSGGEEGGESGAGGAVETGSEPPLEAGGEEQAAGEQPEEEGEAQ